MNIRQFPKVSIYHSILWSKYKGVVFSEVYSQSNDRGVELPLKEALALERKMIAEMATPEERKAAQDAAAATQKTYARIFNKT